MSIMFSTVKNYSLWFFLIIVFIIVVLYIRRTYTKDNLVLGTIEPIDNIHPYQDVNTTTWEGHPSSPDSFQQYIENLIENHTPQHLLSAQVTQFGMHRQSEPPIRIVTSYFALAGSLKRHLANQLYLDLYSSAMLRATGNQQGLLIVYSEIPISSSDFYRIQAMAHEFILSLYYTYGNPGTVLATIHQYMLQERFHNNQIWTELCQANHELLDKLTSIDNEMLTAIQNTVARFMESLNTPFINDNGNQIVLTEHGVLTRFLTLTRQVHLQEDLGIVNYYTPILTRFMVGDQSPVLLRFYSEEKQYRVTTFFARLLRLFLNNIINDVEFNNFYSLMYDMRVYEQPMSLLAKYIRYFFIKNLFLGWWANGVAIEYSRNYNGTEESLANIINVIGYLIEYYPVVNRYFQERVAKFILSLLEIEKSTGDFWDTIHQAFIQMQQNILAIQQQAGNVGILPPDEIWNNFLQIQWEDSAIPPQLVDQVFLKVLARYKMGGLLLAYPLSNDDIDYHNLDEEDFNPFLYNQYNETLATLSEMLWQAIQDDQMARV